MKVGVFIIFILVITTIHSETLQLFSVTDSLTSQTRSYYPTGSVRGGTTIYIQGLGFDTTAANNQIYVGTYPCIIPADGATPTTLACVTSDTYQNNDIRNLPIYVYSNGQQASLTSQQGSYSYLNSKTPKIYHLFPSSAIANTYINFYGIHYISNLGNGQRDMGDVISMKIGDTLCSRFDVLQANITPTSFNTISCYSAKVQQAGRYNVTQYLVPGYSTPQYKLRSSSFNAAHYQFTVLPSVSTFTPNSGSSAGQQITITGTGFSNNASDLKVSIDSTDCKILSSSALSINCLLDKQAGSTTRLNTNSLNQSKGYISGSGLSYTRYDITNLGTKTIAGLRAAINSNSPSLVTLQNGFRGQIETGDYYGTNYGQYFRGYFTAPVDGNYVFQGVADDLFAVYLNNDTYGSAEGALNMLIYSSSYQSLDNFYYYPVSTAEATVALNGQQSYYIEVYHINFGGPGFLRVSAQIPNTDTSVTWQTHAVHRLQLSYVNDPEILEYNQTGGTSGKITFTITRRPVGLPPVILTATINYNATISEFITALNAFDSYGPYVLTGVQTLYDSNLTVTTNPNNAYRYNWRIFVKKLRTSTHIKEVFTITYSSDYTGTQSFTQTIVQPHGPLISGTWTLALDNYQLSVSGSTSLRFNVKDYQLQAAIRTVPGYQQTEVRLISNYLETSYGSVWLITYFGKNTPTFQSNFLINYGLLAGGKSSTKPQVTLSVLRLQNSNLLVNPIDYNYLTTPSSKPNLLVTVNGLVSVCTGDCTYTFLTNPPLLTMATRSGSILTLALTDPAATNYTLSDVTISLAGQPCIILNPITSTISNFQCQLPTNSDSSPTIPAGTYMPIATIANIGRAQPDPSVMPLEFLLNLTAVNPSTGGQNGGYNAIISGNGFPLTIPGTIISICGHQSTITAINNIQATVIVPYCENTGPQIVTLNNGVNTTNSISFTYTALTPAVQIFSVTPQSHNPSLKGVMEIRGIGFGSNSSIIRVDLANASGKVYGMRVVELNDTYIKVGIPGGLAGKYKVQVNLAGYGQAMPNSTNVNDFTYELIINSVTPATGSYFGGTLLNLKGINFSPATDETLVFIGNQINWMCTLESVNQTDILCRTPPISPYYNISNPQIVVLTNRLMVDNTCGTGPCQFTYLTENLGPKITSISTNALTTGSVTITGTNLNLSAPSVILTNKLTGVVTLVNPQSSNATTVVFNLPSIEAGQYNLKIRTDPIGESNGFLLKVNAIITSSSPTTISTEGGDVTIVGAGLPASWPNDNYRLNISSKGVLADAKIISCTPKSLTFTLPKGSDGTSYSFSLTTPLNQVLSTTITQTTTATPTITLTSASSVSTGNNTIVLTQGNLNNTIPQIVTLHSLYGDNEIITVVPFTASSGTITFSVVLTAGSYGFKIYFNAYGWASCTSNLLVTTTKFTINPIITSYNGGSFTLTGNGISKSGTIKINGIKTNLGTVTNSSAVATIPPFVTPLSQSTYNLKTADLLALNQFSIISDTPSSQSKAFDNVHGTTYVSSSTGNCYIGIDVGVGLVLDVSKVRFFPYSRWLIAANYLVGSSFEASLDGVTWVNLITIDSTVHSGWNDLKIVSSTKYRFYRFSHNSVSKCQLAELQFEGIIYTDVVLNSLATYTTDIVYEDGANTFTWTNQIEFRQDRTPVINTLNKLNGDVFGGYDLILSGNYLNFATPSVVIDGKTCVINSAASNDTSITCQVASRLTLPDANTFVVKVGDCNSVVYQTFSYVLRWSDIRTWGTDLPPIANDLVFVPKGMNLLVDQSTPILQGILVQNGTLTFADQSDMTISAGFITMRGGKFIAGTQAKPYQHQLTFIMYGNYYGPQQPMFGNKVIGCLQCFFSMHGAVRQYTWTRIASTVKAGDSQLTVLDSVDWKVGEKIAIASTSYNHMESQNRTITAISGKVITVDKPFVYQHYSGIENYGSDSIEMRAEVGLLTRNIKVMGDDTSQREIYGAHLMMAGSAENGLIGRIAYSEFTDCGQQRIIGRYCIHFHMNGDVSDSYARGNAVHNSLARVITLHGVHYLTVEKNVGYLVSGHNFFIEDGIQTHNLLQYNLAISSRQVWTMLQTDISVASFWVTHPSNNFRYNHAAGSDFYGFWYEIKPKPDGPSASNDVCPMGNPLGESKHNVAHSNTRFGLRIFKLAPRTYPCSPIYIQDEVDPWQYNPGVIGIFSNYTLYKNGQAGLLAEQTGNLIFDKFTIAENKQAGAEFYISQYTKDNVLLRDSVIIGQSNGNIGGSISGAAGVITPRIGRLNLTNIRFYNYPANTRSLETCSKCWNPELFTNTAQQIFTRQISFNNVTGNQLLMNGLKREIIYDTDGTFSFNFDSKTRTSATIVNNYKHLASQSACLPTSNTSKWDNTLACDQTIKIAKVLFNGLVPNSIFNRAGIKVQPINSGSDTVPETSTSFTQAFSYFGNMQPMVSQKFTYALPYAAGRIYNVWWLTGLDFDHLSIQSSNVLSPSDPAILFKFNYTLNRQLYELGPIRPHLPLSSSNYNSPSVSFLDSSNCLNGDYYHDNNQGSRTFQICASGKNRTLFEITDITAVYCRYLCPAPPGQFVKETFVRYWSNISQWPNNRLPAEGQNVTVNGSWTIIMDINPAPCLFLLVDGDVIIPNSADINITCEAIWIRAGSIKAGSASAPFTYQLTFQINGNKNHPGWVFDQFYVTNKILLVTGLLQLYGVSPTTVSAKLTASAFSGDTQISVDNAIGWLVGDQIVIAPSFSDRTQYERVKITAINGNIISFSPALKYSHYGDTGLTINNIYGTLDTRAAVGHVTRNIKIVSGADEGWGYTITVYNMWEGVKNRIGQINLDSVQFTLGGKYDTEEASLVLKNYKSGSNLNTITKSSFSFCRSFCINAVSMNNIDINDNIFYEARKFHFAAAQINNLNFLRNIMIGAIFRPTLGAKQPVACVSYPDGDAVNQNVKISNNLCQGSQGNGFVLPFITCDMIASNPFIDNTAGSAQNGFLLNKVPGGCMAFSGIKAYACKIGQMSSPPNTLQTQFSNFILADNMRAVTLRFGLEDDDKTAYFKDSYITAVSRPGCSYCYGSNATYCENIFAIRMLTTTINGQHYPHAFDSGFDVICRTQTFDCKAYLTNITFDSYRINYTLSQCSNNTIFKPHTIASDLIGSHHLWNSTCTNCQLQAYAQFDPPHANQIGWEGGCGNILCTGRNNYFIEDHTGTFLPTTGVLIANNSDIGDSIPECKFYPNLNGHYCTRNDFAVLEYESIAPDFNTRIMWPVSLNYEGGKWTTLTNGYKQWEWMGKQPLNKRVGRFISLIQLHQRYNMSFAANPPQDMRFQLQKRTPGGNNSDWVVIKLYYPFPNTIQVEVGGKVIKPISLLQNNGLGTIDTTVCGSNKFFYFNYTIHFVVTGDPACMVRVYLTNSIQLTMRFAMNINDFFADNTQTRLVDRMCALLQITDQSRVKIVGVYPGSTQVILAIAQAPIPIKNSKSTTNYTQRLASMNQLLSNLSQLISTGQLNSYLTSNSLPPVLSADAQLIPLKPSEDSTDNTKIVIIAVLVSVIAAVLIAGGLIYFYKKRSNRVNPDFLPQESGIKDDSNKPKELNITDQELSDNVSEFIIPQQVK